MAQHITRWRPDTCGCVIELEWNDEDPPATRVHTPVKVERCGAHVEEPPQHQAVFDTVLAENQFKNEVSAHLLAELDDEFISTVEEGRRMFKHAAKFEFDIDRNLRVTFAGAPEGCAPAARTALETRAFSRAVEIN